MLTISELEEALGDGDWVVVTADGDVLGNEVPDDAGPATILVRPVTDALKMRSGDRITGSVRREDIWAVEGLVLNRVILSHLEGEMTSDELIEAVKRLGYDWQTSQL